MKSIKSPMKILHGLVLSLVCSSAVWAGDVESTTPEFDAAVFGGKFLLNVRPRYEFVDQDGKVENANALTVRTLIGWETKPFHGFAATLQGIYVTRIGSKDYNDVQAAAAASIYPLVADPRNTDLNQVFLDFTGLSNTRFRVGKQSIKLDNVRFVGNVEFRQVMQVFNGLTIENKSIPNTELYFGHLERVKTVFAKQRELQFNILHGAYKITPADNLIGYAYFQDETLEGFKQNSNRILGIRADGAHPFGDKFNLLYTAEYAKQDKFEDGSSDIDADYLRLGVGPRWGDWFIRVDYEKLSSNDGKYAFQTPFGTNHLFQGWVDKFLTTPRQGIRDTFLTAGGKLGKAQLLAEYHRFKSDIGSIDFGKEIDFSVSYPFTKQLTGKMEYGDYSEGDVLTPAASRVRDTTKLWLTLTFNY